MSSNTHPVWDAAMRESMERFDLEARETWAPILEENGRFLVGMFVHMPPRDGRPLTDLAMAIAPAFDDIPEVLWQTVPTDDLLYTLATVVGQMRGDGDDTLMPVYEEDYQLAGLGLITREAHAALRRESSTFYLSDRMGSFYTRRFMGGADGGPEFSFGNIPAGIPIEEATRIADAHPDFHVLHGALSTLLHACVAPPEMCRELYGPNRFAALAEALTAMRSLLDPTHPLNPVRSN